MQKDIFITYKLTLDTDIIQEDLDCGYTYKDIEADISKHGKDSKYVMDIEVESLESIQ